jgi:hypothetical protein
MTYTFICCLNTDFVGLILTWGMHIHISTSFLCLYWPVCWPRPCDRRSFPQGSLTKCLWTRFRNPETGRPWTALVCPAKKEKCLSFRKWYDIKSHRILKCCLLILLFCVKLCTLWHSFCLLAWLYLSISVLVFSIFSSSVESSLLISSLLSQRLAVHLNDVVISAVSLICFAFVFQLWFHSDVNMGLAS